MMTNNAYSVLQHTPVTVQYTVSADAAMLQLLLSTICVTITAPHPTSHSWRLYASSATSVSSPHASACHAGEFQAVTNVIPIVYSESDRDNIHRYIHSLNVTNIYIIQVKLLGKIS